MNPAFSVCLPNILVMLSRYVYDSAIDEPFAQPGVPSSAVPALACSPTLILGSGSKGRFGSCTGARIFCTPDRSVTLFGYPPVAGCEVKDCRLKLALNSLINVGLIM